jgi:hypothetical protein
VRLLFPPLRLLAGRRLGRVEHAALLPPGAAESAPAPPEDE